MKWFKYWVRMLFLLSVLYACARQEEGASARLQAETASVTIRPEGEEAVAIPRKDIALIRLAFVW